MTRLALRFGPLLVAMIFVLMSYGSWTFGTPPTWMQFGPRAEARVLASKVDSYRIGNGTTRHEPVVEVSWPPGTDSAVMLGGMKPEFFAYGLTEATAIARSFRIGDTIPVRVFEGEPFADRISWFGLAHATFMSLMTLVLIGIGLLFFKLFEPERRRGQATM